MRLVIEPPTGRRPHGDRCPQTYPASGRVTILNAGKKSLNDPAALALGALQWILGDAARAQRFLDLTGLTPAGLRMAIADRASAGTTLGAVLDYLCAHEPDLIGASEELGVTPAELAAAREHLA